MVGQGGGFKSKTHTSKGPWLAPSIRITYARTDLQAVQDVLGIDHELLSSNRNAEELQVVRYQQTPGPAPHHDFGDDGTPEQRFLTLLLYIQLPDKGGATSFPKAAGGRGLQVAPARGGLGTLRGTVGIRDGLAYMRGMPITKGEAGLQFGGSGIPVE